MRVLSPLTTLTLDQCISILERIRIREGGQLLCYLASDLADDQEPLYGIIHESFNVEKTDTIVMYSDGSIRTYPEHLRIG